MILSKIFSHPHLTAGFSTKADDIYSSPSSERFRGRIYRVRQVHSNRAIEITYEKPEAIGHVEGDALVTAKKGLLLSVWVADCVPLVMAQEHGRCIAAVHAGWRGLVGGIIRTTLELLKSAYNAPPESIKASVGPAIGACCYEVGNDVSERIAASCGESSVIAVRADRIFADLHSTAKLQLLAAGVQPSNIEVSNLCTYCHDNLFFSRRRGNLSERQCGFVGISEE
jgi:YfiH family protein